MKKVILLSVLALLFLPGARAGARGWDSTYKANFFELNTGVAALPFGWESLNSQSVLMTPPFLGVTIRPFTHFGLYASAFFMQEFESDEMVPLQFRYHSFIQGFDRINSFRMTANSFNLGVVGSDRVTEKLEVFAKIGFGLSFINLEVEGSGNPQGKTKDVQTFNMQTLVGARYRFFPYVSVFHSFTYGHLLPIWRSGITLHL